MFAIQQFRNQHHSVTHQKSINYEETRGNECNARGLIAFYGCLLNARVY